MARLPWQKFDPPVTVIDHAIEYIETHSLVLCAIRPMSKAPYLFNWNDDSKGLSTAAAALAELENTERGVGLLHGPSRTGAFDVDHLEYTKLAFAAFGIDYDAIMAAFPRIHSREGKDKIVFRLPAGFDPDNGKSKIKLTWPDPSGECDAKGRPHLITIFELRGGANQDVLPPSIHPNTEKPYTWAKAPWDFPGGIPAMDGALIAIWREWDRFERQFKAACPWATEPEFDSPPPPIARQVAGPGADVIGQYNAATPIHALLQQHGYKPKGKGRWLAPNSSTKIPGVVFLDEGRKVYSHHASDPLNNGHAHDAFSVFTTLEHNGDIAAAVKAAAMDLGLPAQLAPTIDFSGLVKSGLEKANRLPASRAAQTSAQLPRTPGADIPEVLLTIPGVLGEGVGWVLHNARQPQPVYAVQSMLALGSIVLGRRYRSDHGNWPSLSFLAIGKTATGKESIKSSIERALEASGLADLIGPGKYTSDSGVLSALISKPAHVAIVDEFGKVLAAASDPHASTARDVLRYLMEIWGRCDGTLRPVGYATASLRASDVEALERRLVHKPALTFVGISTPETFYDALSSRSLRDGFLNRLLVCACHASRAPSRFAPQSEPPEALVAWCRTWRPSSFGVAGTLYPVEIVHDCEPAPTTMPFSEAACLLVGTFDAWCVEQMNAYDSSGVADLFGRTNEISMRLAMIVAASCGSTTIEADHLAWAQHYTRFWTEALVLQVGMHVSDGTTDGAMKDVQRLIQEAGAKGYSDAELRKNSRKFAALLPRLQSDVLSVLVNDGAITRVDATKPGQRGGRRRIVWVAADDGENFGTWDNRGQSGTKSVPD